MPFHPHLRLRQINSQVLWQHYKKEAIWSAELRDAILNTRYQNIWAVQTVFLSFRHRTLQCRIEEAEEKRESHCGLSRPGNLCDIVATSQTRLKQGASTPRQQECRLGFRRKAAPRRYPSRKMEAHRVRQRTTLRPAQCSPDLPQTRPFSAP